MVRRVGSDIRSPHGFRKRVYRRGQGIKKKYRLHHALLPEPYIEDWFGDKRGDDGVQRRDGSVGVYRGGDRSGKFRGIGRERGLRGSCGSDGGGGGGEGDRSADDGITDAGGHRGDGDGDGYGIRSGCASIPLFR